MDDRYWAVYWKPMRKETLRGEGAEELNWTKHRSSAAPWRGRLLRAESIRTGYLRARLRHDNAQHRRGVGIIEVPLMRRVSCFRPASGAENYCVCSKVATVLISLRAYFGKPALIELPILNEDCPMRTCAGTRLCSTGTFSKLRFWSSTLALIASATNAVTTVLPASLGWA